LEDTIAAISTPIGRGGIGIVRISGSESIFIADKIYIGNKKLIDVGSHTANYGTILDRDKIVDECIVLVMKAPKTYTKEDIVEIQCHGGIITTQKVIELVLKNGARLAQAGEFTKRAFLNGRIDLSQAEAVMDIINSKTDLLLDNSMNQLKGSLSNKINLFRGEILALLSHIEVNIDYPEYDIEEITLKKIKDTVIILIDKIDKLINTANTGKIIKEGVYTSIVGKPNVGKSSLLNALLKEQRAIVTDIAGTTRDTLEEYVNIHGIPFKIIDTAGIRQTEDFVEKIGVEKSLETIEKADLVIILLDYSTIIDKEDIEIIERSKYKKILVIINKNDLNKKIDETVIYDYVDKENIMYTSLIDNECIEEIEEKLKNMFYSGSIDMKNKDIITNNRHKLALIKSKENLEFVINSLDMGMTQDLISIDLKQAYENLGEITGDSVSEDITHEIFGSFCIGK